MSTKEQLVNRGGWGVWVSFASALLISVGLALQKVGRSPRSPRWLLGLVLLLSGEIGNLLAYGDRGTPTAVIASVGCMGARKNINKKGTISIHSLSRSLFFLFHSLRCRGERRDCERLPWRAAANS